MTYKQIQSAIATSNLTSTELRNLNDLLIAKLKSNRSIQAVSIKQSLQVGMTIMVDHPSHKSSVFTIEKINRTKVVITDSRGRHIIAPLSMVIPM